MKLNVLVNSDAADDKIDVNIDKKCYKTSEEIEETKSKMENKTAIKFAMMACTENIDKLLTAYDREQFISVIDQLVAVDTTLYVNILTIMKEIVDTKSREADRDITNILFDWANSRLYTNTPSIDEPNAQIDELKEEMED